MVKLIPPQLVNFFSSRKPDEDTPAENALSDADVRDYVGIMSEMVPLGAADLTTDFTQYPSQRQPDGYINKALDSDVYGGRKISYINRFDRFEQLEQVSPRVSMGLSKLGLKLRGSEFKLYIAIDAALTDEIKHGMLQDGQQFVENLGLQEHFAAAGRLTGRDGTVPILNTSDKRAGNGEGITKLDYIPMSHCTLLPRDVQPMSGFQNIEQLWEYGTILGEVTQCIINERMMAKREIHYLKNGRITLIRFMHQGYGCRDIYQRRTKGIYGISLMDQLDVPAIKPLCDIIWGYSKAIGRYGFGRLHIENEMLAKMVEAKLLTPKQAANIAAMEQKVLNTLEPNRDILTIGKTVKEVAGTFGASEGILAFKESLERDISYVLCETEAGSGKARGTTFASASSADSDNNRVLEAMRNQIRDAFESIIQRHLTLIGWAAADAMAVKIDLAPIELPPMEIQALLQYNAQALPQDQLTRDQLFEMCGWHLPPLPSVGNENIGQPNPAQPPETPGNGEPLVPGLTQQEKPTFYLTSKGRCYLTAAGMHKRRGEGLGLKLAAGRYKKTREGTMINLYGANVMVLNGDTEEESFERQTGITLEEAAELAQKEKDFEKSTGGWDAAIQRLYMSHGNKGPV
ncbi:MAG: hypothetical protein ABR999_10855 [Methanoregula sp.]|jgi:hypothetical protein|uniref:hypothetical protein n=1 Tax=Methanoregula sp. TaxID=2052170 RepID=UPI003D0AF582